jgi:hypothetical protein
VKLFPLFISALGSRKQQKEWGRFFLLAAANAMHLIMWRARAAATANLIIIERARFEVPKVSFARRFELGLSFRGNNGADTSLNHHTTSTHILRLRIKSEFLQSVPGRDFR